MSSGLGEEAWVTRRKEWTTSTLEKLETTASNQQEQHIVTLNDDQKLNVYQALITERRSFKKPIPLGIVVDIVIHGWKKNGTWPDDEEAPK
ncbi:hypothetical protein BCR42DRAFT_400547 [Absidia repens]|uniref:Gag1-like clamp domain-containing protein n=1 Tax=Absidia repens TaxID=90262 RepID=A0A1X2J1C9_9FUNG|nr:hypothetical protein BCR42DRAFT_400547 [Absidia repens]